MIKVVCPACKEEKDKYEIVNVSAQQRRYKVRCPDCGKVFEIYGQHMEGQPPLAPKRTQNRKFRVRFGMSIGLTEMGSALYGLE